MLSGITAGGYNGKFVVSEKLSSTQFKYEVQNAPANALPTVTGGVINLNTDTVTSASPYMFNLSLRSVFGMNGLHADGQKATGLNPWLLLSLQVLDCRKMITHFYSTTQQLVYMTMPQFREMKI